MGFWSGLKRVLEDLDKRHAESVDLAYPHGRLTSYNGSPNEYSTFRAANHSPQWLAAYAKGYQEGREERVRSGRE